MSEKQATGISKILRVLKNNESPEPEFYTDEDRTFLETTIRIRDGFEMSDKMSDKMSEQEMERLDIILTNLIEGSISSKETADLLNIEQKTARRLLSKAVSNGLLERIGSNKNRRYTLPVNKE